MTKLLETLLTSEFKFGFELEAYAPESLIKQCIVGNDREKDWDMNVDWDDSEEEEESHWDDDQPIEDDDVEIDTEKLFDEIKYICSQYFGSDIKIVSDGSLGDNGFEFPTPPMSLTPTTIQRCIKFLNEIHTKYGIYTDETCGFHVHFSFPQMNKKDMAWIVCQVAMNDKYWHELTQFTTEYDSIEFLSNWASTDFLTEIRDCINKDDGNLPDFKKLSSILSSDKYRLLRIHPQGTLEWRGPRNFMNEGNINLIYEFFYKVLRVSRMFADCMDKKYLGKYLNRSSFDKILDFSNIELKPGKINSKENIYEKLAKSAIKQPLVLTKLKNYSNFNYDKLIVAIGKKSLIPLLTDIRYKEFKSPLMLEAIIEACPKFCNYVEKNLTNALEIMFTKINNPYNLFVDCKLKPDVLEELVLAGRHKNTVSNLKNYFIAIKNKPNSYMRSEEAMNILVKIYGKAKIQQKRESYNI